MQTATDTYVGSASYAPCPDCGEGSLTWDVEERASRCTVCGVAA